MAIDWAGLISAVRDLVNKVREGNATVIDWVDTLYLVLSVVKTLTARPVIGTNAGHDAVFESADDENAALDGVMRLIHDLAGDVPMPAGAGGAMIRAILPILLKALIPLLLTQNANIASQVICGVLEQATWANAA